MAVDPIDLIRLAENGSDWLRPALTGWDRLGPAGDRLGTGSNRRGSAGTG